MDKKIYTLSGIILIILGILLIYETYANNLIDIMFIIGIILIILGICIIILNPANTIKDDLYKNTVKSLNNKKSNLEKETRRIVELDKNYQLDESESIFTSINKQFAERFNEPSIYEKPKKYNPSLNDYEDVKTTTQETQDNKKVLRVNENWNEPTEDLKPIKTEHIKEPPASIYNENETQSYNFKAKYKRPEKITRKPKKRANNPQETKEQITPKIGEKPEEKTKKIKEPTIIPNITNDKNTVPTSQIKDNSYILCDEGIISSKEAFDTIIRDTEEEILIQTPTLKNLSAPSLATISKLRTKLLIKEFDKTQTKYELIINTLTQQGVEIRLLSTIENSNLISDKKKALIISKNHTQELQYGTTYTDIDSVNSITSDFNTLWDIAKEIK